MSSKLYRAGREVAAEPIAWRGQDGAIPVALSSAVAVAPKDDVSKRDREIEARIADAYKKGLAAGDGAASQRANARLEPVVAGLSSVIQELAGARKRVRDSAEEDTVKLALAIARRVLNRELATDPEAILGLVRAAFNKCDARETHRLRVSPADLQAIQDYRAELNLPPGLEIAADAALIRGSAVFETSRGELDASADTQLIEIERGLADVLARRR